MTKHFCIKTLALILLAILCLPTPSLAETINSLQHQLTKILSERAAIDPHTKYSNVEFARSSEKETRIRQLLAIKVATVHGVRHKLFFETVAPLAECLPLFWQNNKVDLSLDHRLLTIVEDNATLFPILLTKLSVYRVTQLVNGNKDVAAEKLIMRTMPRARRLLLDFECVTLLRGLVRIYKRTGRRTKCKTLMKMAYAHSERMTTPSIFGIKFFNFRKTYSSYLQHEQIQQSWFGFLYAQKKSSSRKSDCSAKKDFPLHSAVLHGEIDEIEKYVRQGLSFNEPNDEGQLPLHKAALSQNFAVYRYVFARTSSRNHVDNRGNSPLHTCTESLYEQNVDTKRQEQALQIFAHLLQRYNADQQNLLGLTPLHYLAENGATSAMRVLLQHCRYSNPKDAAGQTPIHKAVRNGRTMAVRQLIASGANINSKDILGTTALHLAALDGSPEMTSLLLDKGAQVGVKDCSQLTPLQFAKIEMPEKTKGSDIGRGIKLPVLGSVNFHRFSQSGEQHSIIIELLTAAK